MPNAGLTTSSPEDRVAPDVAIGWSGVERKAKVRNAGERLFDNDAEKEEEEEVKEWREKRRNESDKTEEKKNKLVAGIPPAFMRGQAIIGWAAEELFLYSSINMHKMMEWVLLGNVNLIIYSK